MISNSFNSSPLSRANSIDQQNASVPIEKSVEKGGHSYILIRQSASHNKSVEIINQESLSFTDKVKLKAKQIFSNEFTQIR
jgi:hypothetical protein